MSAADTAKLVASLGLKDSFSGPLKKIDKALGGFDAHLDKSASRSFRAGQQIGTGIKAGAVIAVGAITGLAALSIDLAKEGQDAANVQTKFATAIQNSGRVSADYVKILNAQQDAILNLTGADDELVKAQQTTLITMGLTGKQIATVIPLIFDAAKATGKDVEAITLAVGKAVQGNVAGLGRLGIVLPKATKAQKSAALAALEHQRALLDIQGNLEKARGSTKSTTLATLEYNKAQLAIAENSAKSHGALTKEQTALYAQKKAAIEAAIGQQRLTETRRKGVGASLAQQKAALDAAIGQQKLIDAQKKAAAGASSYDTVVGALTKRFQGTSEALSGSLDVRLKVFNERLANIREEAGQKLLPAMTRIVDVVSAKLVPAFGKFIDTILPVVISGLDKIGGFLEGGGAEAGLSKFLDVAKQAAPLIQNAALSTLAVMETAQQLFSSLPPEIQSLAVAGLAINKLTGGLVTNLAGGLISAVISSFKGLMNVNAAVVNVNGGVVNGGLPGALPAAGAGAAGVGVGLLGASAAIGASVAATIVGSAAVRGAVDQAISGGDIASLTAQAEAARKHGVSDTNNAALKALQAIVHNTASLATPTTPLQSAQDASEKAQQARNAAFTSNPTRADLRHRIAEDKANLEHATGKNAVTIGRHLAHLQSTLDHRIATSNKRVADAMSEAKRAIVAAVEVSKPVINVPVTTQTIIDGRLVSANFSRYTSVIGGKVVNATSGSGV